MSERRRKIVASVYFPNVDICLVADPLLSSTGLRDRKRKLLHSTNFRSQIKPIQIINRNNYNLKSAFSRFLNQMQYLINYFCAQLMKYCLNASFHLSNFISSLNYVTYNLLPGFFSANV